MKINKIALGTAQFGMDYGINNKRGKIHREEVFAILNEASKSGIDTLDTAYSYGESETVIGEFIKEYKEGFKIISKLPECDVQEVENIFDFSLKRLGVDALYGYMIHSFQNYKEYPEIWNILERLKSKQKIEKIGFSLYSPYELDYILENRIKIDIIQVPYSIFDQRFEQYFPGLKEKGVEIYIRSVFLQGLAFKNPDELYGSFAKIKEKIKNLNSLSIGQNIPIVALCLNFAALNRFVDRVVVGIDGIDNLKEIVSSLNYLNNVKNMLNELYCFKEDDENIILPLNWKAKT